MLSKPRPKLASNLLVWVPASRWTPWFVSNELLPPRDQRAVFAHLSKALSNFVISDGILIYVYIYICIYIYIYITTSEVVPPQKAAATMCLPEGYGRFIS